jgi:hypothetical protein
MAALAGERHDRVAAMMGELAALARELAALSQTAAEASAGGDIEGLLDASERMLGMHVRYAELYRTLLVVRLGEPGGRPLGAGVFVSLSGQCPQGAARGIVSCAGNFRGPRSVRPSFAPRSGLIATAVASPRVRRSGSANRRQPSRPP